MLQEQNTGLHKTFNQNTISISRMSLFTSKRPYVCLSVRSSILDMCELLLIYCYSKNLRIDAFVCLFNVIFVVTYKTAGYPAG